ncbi:hypothetical protein HanOQP8_Chr03g0085721 [Helianthus annuus]|nr:hypothetical protein HanOQP8_Chr03g0085721 [Helianthus annuus]
MIMWFCISWFYMRGISGIKDSRSSYKERLKPKGLDCLESIEIDHEFLCKSHKGYNFEWRGVVGWGFGCVFFFASLGILGWVMDWAPQTFLLNVESIDGEVGLWVGGNMGNAVIRSTSQSWVVFWLLQPSFRPLCWVLVFGLIFSWCVSRLGMSLCLGDIRQDQIFAVWFCCFTVKVCFLSTKQRSENLWLGQKLVCVVYFGSIWICTLVPKGGGVSFWESGGIRDSKAKRVVILLKSLCHSTAVIFHSVLFLCLIGNLNLFLCFVVSLKGSLTILTTSATVCGRLGLVVLWGGTHYGDIRLEIATMFRTLYSTPKLVFYFLDLISGNQSHLYWFLSKPVSWFFAESFESDLLGSKGILGSWGWVAVIRRRDFETMLMYLEWQKCRGYVKTDSEWQGHCGNSVKVLKWECWGLDSYLNAVVRQIMRIWKDIRSYQHCRMLVGLPGLFYSHKKVVFGKHRRLQGYYWKYTSSRINLQDCDDVTEVWRFIRAAKLVAVIINWKGYNGDFTKNGYITDGLHSEVHNWYNEKMLIWRGWGLNGYIFEVIRQFMRVWRSNSCCHYCSLLIWMIGAIWKYWKYGNKRQVQTVQKNECNNFDTLEARGTERFIRDTKIKLLKLCCLKKQWNVCRSHGQWKGQYDDHACQLNRWLRKKGPVSATIAFYVKSRVKDLGLEKYHNNWLKFVWWNWLVRWVFEDQMKYSAKKSKNFYDEHWIYKVRGIMRLFGVLMFVMMEDFRQYSGWMTGLICMRCCIRARIIVRLDFLMLVTGDFWTERIYFNNPIIVWAKWDGSSGAAWFEFVWPWKLEIVGTNKIGEVWYWAVWTKWRPNREQGTTVWSGGLEGVYDIWDQGVKENWGRNWEMRVLRGRKWTAHPLGRNFYGPVLWSNLDCLDGFFGFCMMYSVITCKWV